MSRFLAQKFSLCCDPGIFKTFHFLSRIQMHNSEVGDLPFRKTINPKTGYNGLNRLGAAKKIQPALKIK
jgi:hypothetical protein